MLVTSSSSLPASQESILRRLKMRGPQSVKILAKQLAITTMGVRQHLAELDQRGLVEARPETRQPRGRPVHYWQLTALGHQHFPDAHGQTATSLITALRDTLGEKALQSLIDQSEARQLPAYQQQLESAGPELAQKLMALAEMRTAAGFMAEIRLTPDGWLLIENHCPIFQAASSCQHYCQAELEFLRTVLSEFASVERADHLLAGARRCAYKISAGKVTLTQPQQPQ